MTGKKVMKFGVVFWLALVSLCGMCIIFVVTNHKRQSTQKKVSQDAPRINQGENTLPNRVSPGKERMINSIEDLTDAELLSIVMAAPIKKGTPLFEVLAERCGRVFGRCVRTHPWQEIRENLSKKIKSGKLVWRLIDPKSNLGEIKMLAALRVIDVPQMGGDICSLDIDIQFLLDPSVTDFRRQLGIAHEYVHFQQLESGKVPKAHFRGISVEDINEEYVRLNFSYEYEAYFKEAVLAKTIGIRINSDASPSNAYLARGEEGFLSEFVRVAYTTNPQFKNYFALIRQLEQEKLEEIRSENPR